MSDRRKRVLFGGLVHETHTFLERQTRWPAFGVRRGREILDLRGDSSPTGGFLQVADRHGWHVEATLLAIAEPGPTIADAVLERYWKEFRSLAAGPLAAGIDAIYLVLHGAGTTATHRDLEGELLRRIRQLPGAETLPIFGVYDLHANFSEAMAEHANCLIAYRENPHTDAKASAVRSAEWLHRCLTTGVKPRQVLLPFPILWPPTGTATAVDPMRSLIRACRRIEAEHSEIWAVNLNAGFSFGDGPHVGVSASVVTTGAAQHALEIAEPLRRLAIEQAELGNVLDRPVNEVFDELQQLRSAGRLDGLTVLVEPSDNIGGGGPGDGMTLMRRLIEAQFENVAFCLGDAAAVATLQNHSIGEEIAVTLGGRGSRLFDGPLVAKCRLMQLADGRFELEDKQSHLAAGRGDFFDMGPCAVVQCGGVTVLITTVSTPTMDLGQWRHFGFNPEDFSIMVVKAAVAHRRAFDPIAARQIWVDTPGPCSSNLHAFGFEHLRRPIFPLDPITHL